MNRGPDGEIYGVPDLPGGPMGPEPEWWPPAVRAIDEAFGPPDPVLDSWFPHLDAERAAIDARFRERLANLEREHAERRVYYGAMGEHREAVKRAVGRLDRLDRAQLRRLAVLEVRCPVSPGKGKGGCVLLTVYRTGPGHLARPRNPMAEASYLAWDLAVNEPEFWLRCRHGNATVRTDALVSAVESGQRVIGPPGWSDGHPET